MRSPLPQGQGRVTFLSSNPAVATVNEKGVVTGVSKGSADITVRTKDGNFSAVCKVTVSVPIVKALKGGKAVITASVENGRVKTTCEITVIQHVTSVALKTGTLSLYTGKTAALSVRRSGRNAGDNAV